MENENVKKATSGSKVVLLTVVAAIVVALVAAVVLYFTVFTSPVRIYKNIVADAVDSTFELAFAPNPSAEKLSTDMELDITLDLNDEDLAENPVVELINKLDLAMNVQVDNKTNNSVVHLNSKYDNENLLNLSMFLDSKKAKAYLYAKEFLDKYIEVDMGEEMIMPDTSEMEEVLESFTAKEAKKIVVKEISNIVTDKMCSKEDGYYVLSTTSTEIVKGLGKAFKNLSKNEDYLDCYENPKEVKQFLQELADGFSELEVEPVKMKILLETDMLLNTKKVIVKIDEVAELEITYEDDEKVEFAVKASGQTVISGEVTTKETKDSVETKITLDMMMVGKITVETKLAQKEIKELDKINSNKVVKIDELTMDELNSLLAKFEDSKLAELVEDMSGLFMPEEPDYDFGDMDVVDDQQLKQVEATANLAWANAYVSGIRDEVGLKNAVMNELKKGDFDLDKYDIVVTTMGVTVSEKSNVDDDFNFDLEINDDTILDIETAPGIELIPDVNTNTSSKTVTIKVNGKKDIQVTIPKGYEETYSATTSVSYKKSDINCTMLSKYAISIANALDLTSKKAIYEKDTEYYKDIKLSEMKTMIIDGIEYSYKDFTYVFKGIFGNINYYERHLYKQVLDEYGIKIEIVSKGQPLTDAMVKEMISIKY